GKAETGPGLGLIEAAAAIAHLLALLRGEAGPVIVDHEAHHRAAVAAVRHHFQVDARLRPLAGVVDQVADHLLEILALAAKARRFRRVDVDGDTAIAMDLLHGAGERRDHRRHLGDAAHHGGARRDARPPRIPPPLSPTESGRPRTLTENGSARDAASFTITDSGVLSACARLPTWVRARSTISRLASISALVSRASGAISSGKRPSSRSALPARIATSASEMRFKG